MPSKKRLVVVGACGAHSRSIIEKVHEKLKDSWSVIALTQQEKHEHSKLYEKLGISVKHFQPTRSSLTPLLQGAHCVFASPNGWDPNFLLDKSQSDEKFLQELVIAAASAAVKHLIWLSLCDVREINTSIPSFQVKNRMESELWKMQTSLPCTFLYPGLFMQNFVKFLPIQLENDIVRLRAPFESLTELPLLDLRDIGNVVVNLLPLLSHYAGKRIWMSAEKIPVRTLLQEFAKAFQMETVSFQHISEKEFIKQSGSVELAETLRWFEEKGYSPLEKHIDAKALYPNLKKFDSWLQENLGLFKSMQSIT